MTCEHKKVFFGGVYSLIGDYVCQDCKLKIDPIVYHFWQGIDHVWLRHSGLGFSEDAEKCLQHCVKRFAECMRDAIYQPPRYDHPPTPEEKLCEEQYQRDACNNAWLAGQYNKIIQFHLGV